MCTFHRFSFQSLTLIWQRDEHGFKLAERFNNNILAIMNNSNSSHWKTTYALNKYNTADAVIMKRFQLIQ